jgi:thiamine pyrophosphokinase
MKTALIVCNGLITDYELVKKKLENFSPYDLIVTVDGGVKHTKVLDYSVDAAVGDFDSIDKINLEYIKQNKITQYTFPENKDKTDTELAVDFCIEKKYNNLIIIAYNGTRLDHSLANIFMFAEKSKLALITLVNENNLAYYVRNSVSLSATEDEYVSIIPVTESITVKNTDGLFYSLSNIILERGKTVGVSNYAVKKKQSIELSEGIALITVSCD